MKKRSFSLVQSWGSLTLVHSNLERVLVDDANVVVEIVAATICEADRRFVSGSKRVEGNSPCTTLGHEAVGQIVAVGSKVKHLKVGQLVVIMPHQVPDEERKKKAFVKGEIFKLHTHHCGMHCDGTIANHIEWPAEWVRPIPKAAMNKAMLASAEHGLHWTLPLAEIEHMACVMTSVEKGFFRWSRTYLPTEACGSGPHLYLQVGSLRTLGKFDSKERLLHFLMASPDGLSFVGFVKRSGSPPQTPPTHRPQGLLQTSPTKRTAERTMRAGVPHEDPMLDGGLRGRCARWGVMMRVDWRVTVAW